MAELFLALFVVGALLVLDRERLSWVAGKARELYEWLSSLTDHRI